MCAAGRTRRRGESETSISSDAQDSAWSSAAAASIPIGGPRGRKATSPSRCGASAASPAPPLAPWPPPGSRQGAPPPIPGEVAWGRRSIWRDRSTLFLCFLPKAWSCHCVRPLSHFRQSLQ